MIQGNQTWQNALLQRDAKQALYVFEIPDYGVILASFIVASSVPPSSVPVTQTVTLGGYGITLYGIGGYGT